MSIRGSWSHRDSWGRGLKVVRSKYIGGRGGVLVAIAQPSGFGQIAFALIDYDSLNLSGIQRVVRAGSVCGRLAVGPRHLTSHYLYERSVAQVEYRACAVIIGGFTGSHCLELGSHQAVYYIGLSLCQGSYAQAEKQ